MKRLSGQIQALAAGWRFPKAEAPEKITGIAVCNQADSRAVSGVSSQPFEQRAKDQRANAGAAADFFNQYVLNEETQAAISDNAPAANKLVFMQCAD